MGKIELSVPADLSEITLGQYQKYMKVVEQNKGEEYNDFLNKKLVEIFCDVNLNDVESIPIVEFNKVLDVMQNAFEKKYNLKREFKLLGVDMGFMPKLDDMSLGEYVDLDHTISDWQQMNKAMAVLYRPINFRQKDKYTVAPYKPSEEISELMREMPMDVVMGAVVFFYSLGIELSKASLNYLQEEVKKVKTSQLVEALERNGDGINQFMDSLKETSQNLTKLPKNHYLNA